MRARAATQLPAGYPSLPRNPASHRPARRARLLARAEGRPYGKARGSAPGAVRGGRSGRAGGRAGRQAAGARGVPGLASGSCRLRRTRWSRRCGAAIFPQSPRNAVQHHVTRLRRALGEDAIRLAADGYALDGAVVDAIEFEELLAAARGALRAGDARGAADTIADALALWRGPALLGLPQSSWATAEAARLDSLRLDALEEHFEAALALGEHAHLVPGDTRCAGEEPVPRASVGALDARPLPRRTTGGRARGVPRGPPRALGGAGAGTGPGAAAPPGGDPRSRPGDRTRPRRTTAARQRARVRRPRSSAARRSSPRWSSFCGSIASSR